MISSCMGEEGLSPGTELQVVIMAPSQSALAHRGLWLLLFLIPNGPEWPEAGTVALLHSPEDGETGVWVRWEGILSGRVATFSSAHPLRTAGQSGRLCRGHIGSQSQLPFFILPPTSSLDLGALHSHCSRWLICLCLS